MLPVGTTNCPSRARAAPRGGRCVALAVVLLAAMATASCDSGETGAEKASWTPEEIAKAKDFWDIHVLDLMQAGMIERHEVEGRTQVVYVDRTFWKRIGQEEKESLLSNLSRSNEILGRNRHIEIRDRISGKVYAEGDANTVEVHPVGLF